MHKKVSLPLKCDPNQLYLAHHVIFVVHGMGRQLEEFGNYERNGMFRQESDFYPLHESGVLSILTTDSHSPPSSLSD